MKYGIKAALGHFPTAILPIVLFLFGCAGYSLPARMVETPSVPSPAIHDTRLAAIAKRAGAGHPGESGFYLLDKGEDALLWRGALANAAEQTLDLQYFIWNDDNVGRIAAERVLSAAQRGVRVRVMVDDIPLKAAPRHLALLNAHPNIEIRIYNPLGPRSGSSSRFSNMLWDFSRLNRRMHNKVFIADGHAAIVGGRNIGDEYFDMHEGFNFRDIDVLTIGPIVNDISVSFDTYWNSHWVYPVEQLLPAEIKIGDAADFYADLHRYAENRDHFPARYHHSLRGLEDKLDNFGRHLLWGEAELICDQPGKNPETDKMNAFGRSGQRLTQIALQTHEEIIAETPYLVMMPGTFEIFEKLNQRGAKIKIITNSLETTDIISVYAGYSKQRNRILRLGVELYELRPDAEIRKELIKRYASMKQKPSLSLHAKTAVFDRQKVFIGTFNLDPRSTHLNTEIGLLIANRQLAAEVSRLIGMDASPENSWRVKLNSKGDVTWTGLVNGKPVVKHSDPNSSIKRGFQFLLFSLVPISSLL